MGITTHESYRWIISTVSWSCIFILQNILTADLVQISNASRAFWDKIDMNSLNTISDYQDLIGRQS